MTKSEIRDLMRQSNRSINAYDREKAAKAIFRKVEQSEQFASARSIAIYAALPDELPTLSIINKWYGASKRILLPRVVSATEMEFFDFNPAQMASGNFGIEEPQGEVAVDPSQIDLIIVPALAFTRGGARLGRGAGYYDRYLSRCRPDTYKIGVGYAHQIIESIPCEAHDISLNEVISDDHHTLPSIILATLDAAGEDATRLRCSVDYLNTKGLTWVLLRYSIRLDSAPEDGEKISIETWISNCNRVTTSRNFILRNSRGECIGEAISNWCMIDLETRHAVNLTSAEINYAQYITQRAFTIAPTPKIPDLKLAEATPHATHLATPYDIDFNNHVNTIRYIEMMLDQLPSALRDHTAPLEAEFNFTSESLLGEVLTIKHEERPSAQGKESLFDITHEDGSTSVRGRLRWSI